MNTRLLMAASALFLLILGALVSFLPQELLGWAGVVATGPAVMALQIIGAAFIGFAALNWSARGVLIGGIYSRPVALGNFFHFAIGAVTLARAVLNEPTIAWVAILLCFAGFALAFGYVLFRGTPVPTGTVGN